MRDNLIGQLKVHITVKEMWDSLQAAFTSTSTTRLRQLQMHLNSRKMDLKHFMTEHLKKKSTMTLDLNAANNVLIKEQQIQSALQTT